VTNYSIPQTRIPAFRHPDCKGVSRKPKTRDQQWQENVRALNGNMASARKTVDVPIPMPQAHVVKGGSYYLRWSAVPAGDRPRMQAYRKVKCVATGKPGGGYVSVAWDMEPEETVPVAWLADAPEWI
jgi:hypothetical protein